MKPTLGQINDLKANNCISNYEVQCEAGSDNGTTFLGEFLVIDLKTKKYIRINNGKKVKV